MWDRGGQDIITLNQNDNLHADLVLLGIYPQVHGTFNIPLPRKAVMWFFPIMRELMASFVGDLFKMLSIIL